MNSSRLDTFLNALHKVFDLLLSIPKLLLSSLFMQQIFMFLTEKHIIEIQI